MEGKKMCGMAKVGFWLMVVGGLNWGLAGIGYFVAGSFDAWNVVKLLLGSVAWLEAVVYILVGVSALVGIWGCKCATCKSCCEVKQ